MTSRHIKALEALQKKRSALQEKEDKVKGEIMKDLSSSMVEARALEIDFDILMGGILEIIQKAKSGDKQSEAWKEAGQKFRQRKVKNHPSPPKKVKKDKNNDE